MCIWDHHPRKKQLLLGQSPAGVSQLTMTLCNHRVQGNKGYQIKSQQETVKSMTSTGHDHSPHIPTRRSPGQVLTPYARTFPIQLQTEQDED